ncbi:MBL fold metallo-hydrolase [Flavihumibacter sp. R14]|nr:MBL fold metallo-hydrolase [Flavihumibacter soli]
MEPTHIKQNIDYFDVAAGVWGMKIVIVNIYMVSKGSDSGKWILIDAGVPGSTKKIMKMASRLFGENSQPSAIILTHGHFDHAGSVKDLLKYWDVPVYAHHSELPYLTGKSAYPPPDPSVGGGLMSSLSWTFPRGPINLKRKVKALPEDGTVPVLQDWKFLHTPGHSPGHISLFRESDRTLIAGDAFVTTKTESAIASLTQKKQLSGPPKYFTNNWVAAERSVKLLADLEPMVAATGHGVVMKGEELKQGLKGLIASFQEKAVPKHGRYVNDPAITNDEGVQYLPPKPFDPLLSASVFGLAALAAYTLVTRVGKHSSK